MEYKTLNKDGFSLMEIIISLGIVTIGIVSIISMFNDGLRNELKSQKKMMAVYLAQEGVEVVRWQRDTNWKNVAVSWDDNFNGIQSTGNDGIVKLVNVDDVSQGWEIVEVFGSGKKKVYYHINNNYYAQSDTAAFGVGWEKTNFLRWITIDSDCGADCLTVTVNVSHPNLSQDIQIFTRIYDWM